MDSEESSRQKPDRVMAEVEKNLRARFGDEFADGFNRLTKQRDDFKTDLTNAIASGKSGPAMAEFLNGHAWLWKYLYEDRRARPAVQGHRRTCAWPMLPERPRGERVWMVLIGLSDCAAITVT